MPAPLRRFALTDRHRDAWESEVSGNPACGFMQSLSWADFQGRQGVEPHPRAWLRDGRIEGGAIFYAARSLDGPGLLVTPEGPVVPWHDPERAGPRLHNSALVLDDRGDLAFVYRKTLLFDADTTWASPGDSGYRSFRTRAGAFGVGICMDLNDPRFLYWLWRSRLDALAFPTNWVDEGSPVWPYWSARVGGSGAVLVAANTYGTEDDWSFSGRSAILARRRSAARRRWNSASRWLVLSRYCAPRFCSHQARTSRAPASWRRSARYVSASAIAASR